MSNPPTSDEINELEADLKHGEGFEKVTILNWLIYGIDHLREVTEMVGRSDTHTTFSTENDMLYERYIQLAPERSACQIVVRLNF